MPAPPELHDAFKINEATDFSDAYTRAIVKSPAVMKISEVYRSNMDRVRNLGRLPIFLTAAVSLNEAFRVAALYEAGFKLGDPRVTLGHSQFDESAWNSVNAKRIEKTLAHIQGMRNPNSQIRGIGAYGLQIMASGNNPGVPDGLKAILFGMIVDSWTAFEVLSEDLFTALQILKPGLVMGSKAVGFRSRGRIRDSYKKWVKDPAIDAALRDKAIDAIALLRNVLVHASGVADDDFVVGVKTTPLLNVYSSLNDGDEVKVYGDVVKLILDNYIEAALSFLTAVDNWMVGQMP